MNTTDRHTDANYTKGGILVVNYPGIGDAILAYPVISSLARSSRFANSIIAHPRVGLFEDPSVRSVFPTPYNLQLFDPVWYSFDFQHWAEIVSQAKRWDIRVILNMQNEGPLYDLGYYRFKSSYADSFEFWDMDFDDLYFRVKRKPILDDVRALLTANGIMWHSTQLLGKKLRESNRVTVFVGSSEPNKRWGIENWSALLEHLALHFTSIEFIVFAGCTREEADEVGFLSANLRHCANVTCLAPLSLDDSLRQLGESQIIITHDSYPIHYAGITCTPAVGIYLSTDPIVWGSYENPFFAFVTSNEKCDGVKHGTGNCIHFHTTCPNIESIRASVTVNQVASVCETAISRIPIAS
jgi:ADP-heptose:LPS heptosyltransferase